MSKGRRHKYIPPPPRPRATRAVVGPRLAVPTSPPPGVSPKALDAYQHGLRLRERNRLDDAAEAFREAVAASPQFAEAHNDLGLALVGQGKTTEALEAFRRALELQPDHAIVWNNLGTLWLSLGNYVEALPCFEKAVQIAPHIPDLLANLEIARREQAAAQPLNFEAASSASSAQSTTQRGAPQPKGAIRITLCLIAKNESTNLPRLFESVREAADEIVVVDTGSTDDTVSIAQSGGAKVVQIKWRNDFAAAKNEALRHAIGQWIFFLDADMALANGYAAKIRQAVESGAARAYYVNIHSPLADGVTEDVVAHPWLFENVPGLRFEGAIHETIYPSLIARGIQPAQTDIVVHHFGYSSEAALAPRLERNLIALRQQVEDGHAAPIIHFYLGTTLIGLKRYDEAIAELKQAAAIPELHWRVRSNAHYSLIRAHVGRGDLAAAAQSADEAIALYPRDRMAWTLRGRVALQASNFERAADSFAQALTLRENFGAEASLHNVSDAGLEHDLAQALACAGPRAGAAPHYERALAAGLPPSLAANTRAMLAFLYWLLNQTRQAADHLAGAATGEAALEAVEMAATLSGYADQVQDFCRWLVSTHHASDAVLARLGQRPHDPSTRVEELAAHARQLRGAGLLARSAVILQQAIELAPGRPGLHHELGATYALAGDRLQAAQAYVAELSINPNHAPTFHEIGVLYAQDGNSREADAWFGLANQMAPANNSTHPHIADIRQR